jgi:hypothetical protein
VPHERFQWAHGQNDEWQVHVSLILFLAVVASSKHHQRQMAACNVVAMRVPREFLTAKELLLKTVEWKFMDVCRIEIFLASHEHEKKYIYSLADSNENFPLTRCVC